METLRRTALYHRQSELGARFVPFHGWELPVQFSSILQEHAAVRNAAGLFDVSHMGQVRVEGPQALEFLQKVNSNDASRLAVGRGMYSHLLNERGGVVDDVIVSRLDENRYLVVVNAATIPKDVAWLRRHAEDFDVAVEDRSDAYSMLAIQGPKAAEHLEAVSPEPLTLKRFGAMERRVYGAQVIFTRTGYTGENGFEIICPTDIVVRIWRTLKARGASSGLRPCGLGARDTLRLEAGYLLYGSDIDDEHSPLEAGYGWVVKFGKGDFIGKKALEEQKAAGLKRALQGVRLTGRGVPRPGAPVFAAGRRAGVLASATFSPTLKTGIGMGYLEPAQLPEGTEVAVELHGRKVAGVIARIPFYKPPKPAA